MDGSLTDELTQDGHETAIPQLTTLKVFMSQLPQTSFRTIIQRNCSLKEVVIENVNFTQKD